jgi:hypothetical protein
MPCQKVFYRTKEFYKEINSELNYILHYPVSSDPDENKVISYTDLEGNIYSFF